MTTKKKPTAKTRAIVQDAVVRAIGRRADRENADAHAKLDVYGIGPGLPLNDRIQILVDKFDMVRTKIMDQIGGEP